MAIDEGCRDDIPTEMVDKVILKEMKTVKEQIDSCPADRTDLKDEYQARYDVFSEYAPQLMSAEEVEAIESENHSLLDKLVPPYPVNVTAQMLDCFSEKYDLPEKKVTDVDELPIGYIAEELWIYSKSVEFLTEPEDACYLAAQTQDIQLNITEMLCLLKNKLPVKDVDWLIEICDNVFSGEKFDDIMFNNVIEHFIQKKIEQ